MIDKILDEIGACRKCNGLEPWKKFEGHAHGNKYSKFKLISEAPGEMAIGRMRYWSGVSGTKIRNILRELTNYELEEFFYFSDIVKCLPPNNRTPRANEIEKCKSYLRKEIDSLKPTSIIVFGNEALKFFINNYRCNNYSGEAKITLLHNDEGYKILNFESFELIPLIHPSVANRFMNYQIYRQHLKEIFQEIIRKQLLSPHRPMPSPCRTAGKGKK